MSDNEFVIPFDRLPPGFVETLGEIPDPPAPTRPAATIVLLRRGQGTVETLMLRRNRRSGFVPGAWVFAGGRVDPADASPEVASRLRGLDPARGAARLALEAGEEDSAMGYFAAALREAFEETGILVGRTVDGNPAPGAADHDETRAVRDLLLADEIHFGEALDRLGVEVDLSTVAYIAHWITPVQEPRRYDTRFFAAEVSPDREFLLHASEMAEGLWISPGAALDRHAEGSLPMVFPTIRTLEELAGFETVDGILDHFRGRDIPAILPRLVKTPTGVGLQVPDPD